MWTMINSGLGGVPRCSIDTYSEAYIAKYTSIRRITLCVSRLVQAEITSFDVAKAIRALAGSDFKVSPPPPFPFRSHFGGGGGKRKAEP